MRIVSFLRSSQRLAALKSTEKEVSIKAPWGNIAALTWGDSSKPPVVLSQGRLDVCSGFRPLVSLLPTEFYYISIEMPGNGKSDQLPKYARYTLADYVPTLLAVQKYFNLEQFIHIGHSMSAITGKYFDVAYPGTITRSVELDPFPAYFAWGPDLDSFSAWYHNFYGEYYREDKFLKSSASLDTAPKYTYEQACERLTKGRGLTREAVEHVIDRSLEPAGDGLYRFNYDQRQKEFVLFPLSTDYLQKFYTSIKTPTYCFLAKDSVKSGLYERSPFVFNESDWPHKNFKVKIVEGGHDNHINNPEVIAKDISNFLLEDLTSEKSEIVYKKPKIVRLGLPKKENVEST